MEEIFHVEITNSCSKSFYILQFVCSPLLRKAFDCIKLVLEHSNGSCIVEGHRTFNYSLSFMYIWKEKAGHLGNLFYDMWSGSEMMVSSLPQERCHKGKLKKVETW